MKMRSVFILGCCLSITSVISTLHAQPMRLDAPTQAPGPSLVTQLDSSAGSPSGSPPLVQVQNQGNIIAEVRKMIEAGADPNVVKAFIQNWSARYSVSADEILRLHDIGASTEVLTTLIHRSAELQAQSYPAQNSTGQNPPAANGPNAGYPAMTMTAPPPTVYSYTSPYPAYTYSYLYPDYSYSYWYSPYAFSFGFGWPAYRYSYWRGRPYYGGYYGHSYAWRPGYYGHGGVNYSRGFGGYGGPSYNHGYGGYGGGGPGFSHGGGGHGRR